MKKWLAVLVVALMGVTVVGCGWLGKGIDKYDTLVQKDEECNRAWADVEANYQRRADMIPQLVNVVKGAAKHEKSTLTAVMEARAKATQVKLDLSKGDFEDPAKLAAYQKAQGDLSQALGKLMMVKEAYPELKANKMFENLMNQIEGTENRILRARSVYNERVSEFNLELRRVSGKVINPVTGHEFKPRAFFKAAAGADKAPEVNFNE